MLISNLLYKLYRIKSPRVKNSIRWIVCKLEHGELYSATLRRIFKDYHGVEIGMYSHGGCFVPFQVHPHTTIGRYCSIARKVNAINRYHPMDFKSTHAVFCIANFGLCDEDLVEYTPLSIGSDVWIGENAIILAQVTEIGHGAIIGAGAVVNKNVPPYAVVLGNPARTVRYRFSKEVIDELLASKWWEKDIEEIKPHLQEYQRPYEKLCSDKKGADSLNK